jgi:hypothetical protein
MVRGLGVYLGDFYGEEDSSPHHVLIVWFVPLLTAQNAPIILAAGNDYFRTASPARPTRTDLYPQMREIR